MSLEREVIVDALELILSRAGATAFGTHESPDRWSARDLTTDIFDAVVALEARKKLCEQETKR